MDAFWRIFYVWIEFVQARSYKVLKFLYGTFYDYCLTGFVEWSSVHRTETEEAHGKGVWWLYRRVHGSREKEVRKLFLLLEETIQFLFKTILFTYLYFSFNVQVWTRHIDPIWRLWKSQCLQILGKIQRQVLHV